MSCQRHTDPARLDRPPSNNRIMNTSVETSERHMIVHLKQSVDLAFDAVQPQGALRHEHVLLAAEHLGFKTQRMQVDARRETFHTDERANQNLQIHFIAVLQGSQHLEEYIGIFYVDASDVQVRPEFGVLCNSDELLQ